MYLTRRNQGASLPTLQNIHTRINRLFDDAFDDVWGREGQRTRTWAPPVEIYDTENELVLVAELPGFERGDIDISFDNGQLGISGERKYEEEEGRNYHRNERWYGRFERAFQLPVSVDPEKIGAKLKDGWLKTL